MEKRIYLIESNMKKLREIFGVSRVTVWKALTYKSDNALARKIRYVALTQLNGTASKDLEDSVVIDTNHDEVEHTMPQTFGPRVKLLFYKDTNEAVVYVDGKEDRRENCEDIPAFMALQKEVKNMAMSL